MKLSEYGMQGAEFRARRDIRYPNCRPYHVSRGAHFIITEVTDEGVLAHTGNVKVDDFWPWREFADIIASPDAKNVWSLNPRGAREPARVWWWPIPATRGRIHEWAKQMGGRLRRVPGREAMPQQV